MTEEPRTYVTMAGKTIGQCSSGHWLPLRGDCDLCGAGPGEKCQFTKPARSLGRIIYGPGGWWEYE